MRITNFISASCISAYETAYTYLFTKYHFNDTQRLCINTRFNQIKVSWADCVSRHELRSKKISLIKDLVSSGVNRGDMKTFAKRVQDISWAMFSSIRLHRYTNMYPIMDRKVNSKQTSFESIQTQLRDLKLEKYALPFLQNPSLCKISHNIEQDLHTLTENSSCGDVLSILLAKYYPALEECTKQSLEASTLIPIFSTILLLQTSDDLKNAILFFKDYKAVSNTEEDEWVRGKMVSWSMALQMIQPKKI